MDTLMLKIPSDKKDFFMALVKELSFVQVDDFYTEEEEKAYVSSILESEEDIENGRVISHENLKKENLTWRKRNTKV